MLLVCPADPMIPRPTSSGKKQHEGKQKRCALATAEEEEETGFIAHDMFSGSPSTEGGVLGMGAAAAGMRRQSRTLHVSTYVEKVW
jgi:hypothetical protein